MQRVLRDPLFFGCSAHEAVCDTRRLQGPGRSADKRTILKLIPFSAQYLRVGEPLPFGLRDAAGRLLLSANLTIDGPAMLAELQGQALFAEEAESAEWHRRLVAAVDEAIRKGASLSELAATRPDAPAQRDAAPPVARSLPEQWQELTLQLDAALRDLQPGGDWRSRLLGVHVRARQLYQRRPDASLYWMVYEAGHSTEKYSCHHALLTLLMCEQAAAHLGWKQPWIDSLGRAALTMNVAMQRLQDQLAASDRHINADMRAEIKRHPQDGAELLREAGLPDALCLDVVRLHHEPGPLVSPLSSLPPDRQLAQLLCGVDVFAAKISRRAKRAPMSPVRGCTSSIPPRPRPWRPRCAIVARAQT